MRKITKAEANKRVEAIIDLKLAGGMTTEIRHYAVLAGWGISKRQLSRYVARADAALSVEAEQSRKVLLAHHFAVRRMLLGKAIGERDYRTALAVVADEARLLGLYPDPKLEALAKDLLALGKQVAAATGRPLSSMAPLAEALQQPSSGSETPSPKTWPPDAGRNGKHEHL